MKNNNETMEKRIFYTLAKHNDTVSDDEETMIAKIGFIKNEFCDHLPIRDGLELYADRHDERGWLLSSECSSEEYDMFVKIVSNLYPNVCVFDYDVANK